MRGGDCSVAAMVMAASCLPWKGESFSYFEQLRVAALDVLGVLLDALGILLHQLDLRERTDAGLLHGLLVRRILAGEIDHDLLAFAGMHPVLEQPRGIRIRRRLEHRARAGGDRRAFRRIDDLDWIAPFLGLDDEIAGAV